MATPVDGKITADDGQAAVGHVQFRRPAGDVSDASKDVLKDATAPARGAG
ncbi:hypothetical protein PV682_37480 [Streptomyces niveiscabiei]|nr:hypothetical protein [Streptomyces niveiscabiei]MDX3387095.1 hypothetical protein [Streptomyces niveiscabiei]